MQNRKVNNDYFNGLADGKAASAKEVERLKTEINQLKTTLAETEIKLKSQSEIIKPKVVITVREPIKLDESKLVDIPRRCKDCKCEFVYTVKDQLKFASWGLTRKPKRCPECRRIRRENDYFPYIPPCPLQ